MQAKTPTATHEKFSYDRYFGAKKELRDHIKNPLYEHQRLFKFLMQLIIVIRNAVFKIYMMYVLEIYFLVRNDP